MVYLVPWLVLLFFHSLDDGGIRLAPFFIKMLEGVADGDFFVSDRFLLWYLVVGLVYCIMYVVVDTVYCVLSDGVQFLSLVPDGQFHLDNVVGIHTPDAWDKYFGFCFFNIVFTCECLVAVYWYYFFY